MMWKTLRRSIFVVMALWLLLSACDLPKISFSEPRWVTNLPVSFSGSVRVVEHHVSSNVSFTCTIDTVGKLDIDDQGNAVFTTQGGKMISDDAGRCIAQSENQSWQVEGQVDLPTIPNLKFSTCSHGLLRADGSAEYIVAAYHQDTQTSKLTGGITCYDQTGKPVSEFSLYLTAEEPRR